MTELRLFELTETLEAGSYAQAVLLQWNGKAYAHSDRIVKVHDFAGSHGLPGDRGYCFESEASGRWEVLCGLLPQETNPFG